MRPIPVGRSQEDLRIGQGRRGMGPEVGLNGLGHHNQATIDLFQPVPRRGLEKHGGMDAPEARKRQCEYDHEAEKMDRRRGPAIIQGAAGKQKETARSRCGRAWRRTFQNAPRC